MARTVAGIFERYFVISEVPEWLAVIGMYTQLGNTIFSDAVRREGLFLWCMANELIRSMPCRKPGILEQECFLLLCNAHARDKNA